MEGLAWRSPGQLILDIVRIRFRLRPSPPFRLDLVTWVLRRRPRNAVDLWDGKLYSRVVAIDGAAVLLSVMQTRFRNTPELEVAGLAPGRRFSETKLRTVVERLLGLNVSLSDFFELARSDERLHSLANRFAGFRPPQFPTAFEAAVNAICCQQLSLEVGLEVLNRLAKLAGQKLSLNGSPIYGFPRPCDIATLSPDTLRGIGLSSRKARALLELAKMAASDFNPLDGIASLDDDSARNHLMDLKGIGRWSAEYILLRGFGRLNVFPADDIAAQKNLHRWFGIGDSDQSQRYELIQAALRSWHPYQGLIYFHLLLAGLAERGLCEST